jgi:hypothetical protein
MSRYSPLAAVAAFALLCACGGGPKELPVRVKQCDTLVGKSSVLIDARIFNGADKPAKSIAVAIDFYHDFTAAHVTGTATFAKQLEPNATQTVPVTITSPTTGIGGRAQRCVVTHVEYADGTSADAPAQQ